MKNKLTWPKILVLTIVALFSLVWLAFNFKYFTSTQNGLIRLVLGTAFSILIAVRPKPESHAVGAADSGLWTVGLFSVVRSPWSVVGGCCGAAATITGIVFEVHQLEWLGILLLLASCLAWVMLHSYSRDIFLASFLFYWLHPLPGKIFGSMQIAMQKMSVTGSEWFLHMINIRVWADGLILRTGLNVYEIPAWCSGMRTATTVFILSLGLGILKRLKWYQCAFIAVIAVAQALLLNILRISTMVITGPFAQKEADIEFLHDATGIIIIAAVLLVWIEISLLQKAKLQAKAASTTPNWKFLSKVSEHPPFWRVIFANRKKLTFIFLLILLTAFAVYKRKPHHRAAMIKPVCEMMLADNELENAERAAIAIRELTPSDDEWLMQIARVYIIRGKYEETLALLPSIPDGDITRILDKKILKAYSYVGLEDIEAAVEIMKDIPERTKLENPMVAMVMAEIGMFSNNPEQVARFITRAKEWGPNTRRIHRLYPYLRAHRKWDAIHGSDSEDKVYGNLTETLSAVDAYIHRNDSVTIATITLDAIKKWPEDPRVLTPLCFMTLKRDNPEWETRFAKHLHRCVKALNDPEQLYPLFENCFKITRPDLAWAIYRKIEKIDPSHPALMLNAVRHGRKWFVFRKQFLDISAGRHNDTINITSMLALSDILPYWKTAFSQIPLTREFATSDVNTPRKAFAKQLLREFEMRNKNKTLSLNMVREYIFILETEGQIDKVSDVLDKYTKDISRTERLSILSGIYENKGNWHKVYETLHTLLEPLDEHSIGGGSTILPLSLLLRLCKAQTELRLGIAAIETARETTRLYPKSTGALLNLTRTLKTFDSKEEALLSLERKTPFQSREIDLLKIRLLFDTERFNASEELCHSILIPSAPSSLKTRQSIVLLPAELSLHYHESSTPSPAAFATTAQQIENNLKSTTSPFLHRLLTEWLEVYGLPARNATHSVAGGQTTLRSRSGQANYGLQDVDKFASFGRTSAEKAVALHQFAMLLCHKKDFNGARLAISEAVKHLPESSILWRMAISLSRISSPPCLGVAASEDGSGGEDQGEGVKSKNTSVVDPAVIAEARKHCPDNSEIWLAELVAKTRGQTPKPSTINHKSAIARRATEDQPSELQRYSAEALTRAAEYLFRINKHKEASIIARQATGNAQSLLPAYIIGVRCAMRDKDESWALKCVQGCINSALSPLPAFYESLIDLKSDGYNIDIDPEMVYALKSLRKQNPDNRLWAEMLGYVQFMRSGDGLIDAMYHLTAAMDAGSTKQFVFALAGETARQLGNHENAIAILKTGHKHHPKDKIILNNLIYTLAQNKDTAGEALKYVPKLLKIDKQDPNIIDTVAAALLKANKLDQAEDLLKLILKRHNHIQEYWFRANMRLAEIAILRQNTAKAKTLLTEILNNISTISDEDVKTANKLMERLETGN